MAKRTIVKLNLAGFRALRNDPAVVADLSRRAQAIAVACGPGYTAVAETGRNRARAAVITTSGVAVTDNAANNTLIRNLDAGR